MSPLTSWLLLCGLIVAGWVVSCVAAGGRMRTVLDDAFADVLDMHDNAHDTTAVDWDAAFV